MRRATDRVVTVTLDREELAGLTSLAIARKMPLAKMFRVAMNCYLEVSGDETVVLLEDRALGRPKSC
jgi:uncharacterized protein YfaQ (DUF2300 family)